jgi:hypothetical protein
MVNPRESNIFLESPSFDELRLSFPIELGVPVLDGAVQINADTTAERARLTIDKSLTGITIARTDDVPLQVAVNKGSIYLDKNNHRRYTRKRITVFDLPVDELSLVRAEQERNGAGWMIADPEVHVADSKAFRIFVAVLGQFAVIKQGYEYDRIRTDRW